MGIFIPRNYDESSGMFGGKFKTRNIVEAVIIGLLLFQFTKSVLSPSLSVPARVGITFLVVGIPVGIAVYGIKDDSIGQYLSNLFRFVRNRRKLRMRRVDLDESVR